VNYDFDSFRDYMYGRDAGQTFYYWMYSDEPNIMEAGSGSVVNRFAEARPVRGVDNRWAVDVFKELDK